MRVPTGRSRLLQRHRTYVVIVQVFGAFGSRLRFRGRSDRSVCGAPGLAAAVTPPSYVQITIGGNHTCAVTSGGLIYCWGNNGFGQLGDGATQNRLKPVPVQVGALRFRRVTAGWYHTCAETTDGKAYCWGNNTWGQLGIGSVSGASRLTPVAVAGARTFRQLPSRVTAHLRRHHRRRVLLGRQPGRWAGQPPQHWLHPQRPGACDRRPGLQVGRSRRSPHLRPDHVFAGVLLQIDSLGQLSNGTTAFHLAPAIIAGNRLYKQVSTGSIHSCALGIDDKAYCWGDNFSGQVGDGTTTRSLVPKAVAGGRTYQGLSAGASQNCATDFGSRSYCWGNNAFGALGDGTTTTRLKTCGHPGRAGVRAAQCRGPQLRRDRQRQGVLLGLQRLRRDRRRHQDQPLASPPGRRSESDRPSPARPKSSPGLPIRSHPLLRLRQVCLNPAFAANHGRPMTKNTEECGELSGVDASSRPFPPSAYSRKITPLCLSGCHAASYLAICLAMSPPSLFWYYCTRALASCAATRALFLSRARFARTLSPRSVP